MKVQEQIDTYIAGLPPLKQGEMQELHQLMLQVLPGCKVWFDNGRNSENTTVTNPTIGYGFQTLKYADGKTKDIFRIGLSANRTGISVYILGIKDKTYPAQTYGKELGKASVTGYCIKFKTINDININVLAAAIQYGGEGK